jgi:hypothetical protein
MSKKQQWMEERIWRIENNFPENMVVRKVAFVVLWVETGAPF